jgi:hypothetical protein
MGWVSILDQVEMATILGTAPEWTLIGYFCVGYPSEEHSMPELECEGWEIRRPSIVITGSEAAGLSSRGRNARQGRRGCCPIGVNLGVDWWSRDVIPRPDANE